MTRITIGIAVLSLILLTPVTGFAAQEASSEPSTTVQEAAPPGFAQANQAAVDQKAAAEAVPSPSTLATGKTIIVPPTATPPVLPPPASNIPQTYFWLYSSDKIHSASVIVNPSTTAGYNVISVLQFTAGTNTAFGFTMDTAHPEIIRISTYDTRTMKITTQVAYDYRSNHSGWDNAYTLMKYQLTTISGWPGGNTHATQIYRIQSSMENAKTYVHSRYAQQYVGRL